MSPGEISTALAHGVGQRGDLPLPLWQFTWAATAALVICTPYPSVSSYRALA